MQRRPPRRSEEPTSATLASYYREGRKHLARACPAHPEVCPLEALVRDVEVVRAGVDPTLKPSSSRRYLEDYRAIVAVLGRAARRAGVPVDQASASSRIEAGLLSRRGRPAQARTATLRVTDPSEDELRQTFARLKATAIAERSLSAATAALYLIVGKRVGHRPIELCGAVVDGSILHLPNGKRADGQPEIRRLDISRFASSEIEAVKMIVGLAPPRGNPIVYKQWRNSVASALARASRTATGRRLSLYTSRYVALATWEAAGFTAAEIAEMAGHLSTVTAGRFYTKKGRGLPDERRHAAEIGRSGAGLCPASTFPAHPGWSFVGR